MDKTVWLQRYAARMIERGGLDADTARSAAEAGYEAAIESGDELNAPEEDADEEMSYWTDDGEG